jgi:putative transposase
MARGSRRSRGMTTLARARYAGYRFPAEIIGHAVWLYFRFPLGLRMVEELLAARGIIVSHETVRQWAARKFGQQFANQIRRRLPRAGDKWHLDEVVLNISGMKHWLWRAVDQSGMVLDVLVQRRNEQIAAEVERASEPDRDTVPPRGENATLASEIPGDTTGAPSDRVHRSKRG